MELTRGRDVMGEQRSPMGHGRSGLDSEVEGLRRSMMDLEDRQSSTQRELEEANRAVADKEDAFSEQEARSQDMAEMLVPAGFRG